MFGLFALIAVSFASGWFLREMFHAVKVLRRAVHDAIEIFKL